MELGRPAVWDQSINRIFPQIPTPFFPILTSFPCLQMSWCKLEVAASSAKAVCPPPPGSELFTRASPPLTVASLQLKTVINPASHPHEVCVRGGGGGAQYPHTKAPMGLPPPTHKLTCWALSGHTPRRRGRTSLTRRPTPPPSCGCGRRRHPRLPDGRVW